MIDPGFTEEVWTADDFTCDIFTGDALTDALIGDVFTGTCLTSAAARTACLGAAFGAGLDFVLIFFATKITQSLPRNPPHCRNLGR
jgi:hypothetical protein